jgi:hypothetical protein
MSKNGSKSGDEAIEAARQRRLTAALRANLLKRKVRDRAGAAGAADGE